MQPGKESAGTQPGQARFTIDGSDSLEEKLADLCAKAKVLIEKIVPASELEAILLGGSYGRGEGAVLSTASGDQPYNDLEFFIFVRGNGVLAERRYRDRLQSEGRQFTAENNLDIQFKVLSFEKLRTSGPSMFFYDLVMGHRWILGEESLLRGTEHHRDASKIPVHEATQLMMNRCSGLLFAMARLRNENFTAADSDFVLRNLAKAGMGFGDVYLTVNGQYHWSCRERNQRLQALKPADSPAWLNFARQYHGAGVEFKLHPVRSSEPRILLASQLAELLGLSRQIWLWLESKRLNKAFSSIADYSLGGTNKCPETSAWRNLLVNINYFGLGALKEARCFRHPRQRLLDSLPLLLWQDKKDRAAMKAIQAALRTPANDFPTLVAAYENTWSRFN